MAHSPLPWFWSRHNTSPSLSTQQSQKLPICQFATKYSTELDQNHQNQPATFFGKSWNPWKSQGLPRTLSRPSAKSNVRPKCSDGATAAGSSVPQWEVHAKSANTLTQTPSSMSPFAVTMTVLKKNFLVLWLQHFGHAKVLCKMVNTSGKGKRRKDWTERWENIANKVGAWPIVDTKNMSVYTISSFTIPATPASTYVRCVVPLCSACKSHHVSGRIWSFVRIHSDVWMYSSPCKDELEKWCFGKRLPKYGFNMARFSVFLHKSRIFEPTSKPRPNPLERSSSATKHSTAPNE